MWPRIALLATMNHFLNLSLFRSLVHLPWFNGPTINVHLISFLCCMSSSLLFLRSVQSLTTQTRVLFLSSICAALLCTQQDLVVSLCRLGLRKNCSGECGFNVDLVWNSLKWKPIIGLFCHAVSGWPLVLWLCVSVTGIIIIILLIIIITTTTPWHDRIYEQSTLCFLSLTPPPVEFNFPKFHQIM